jgi:hypothetical protein
MWLRGGEVPDEYVEDYNDLELCKLYSCTPAELDAQDYHRIQRHLTIENAVRRYDALDAEARSQRQS